MAKKKEKINPQPGESVDGYAERLYAGAENRMMLREWFLGETSDFGKQALTKAILLSKERDFDQKRKKKFVRTKSKARSKHE